MGLLILVAYLFIQDSQQWARIVKKLSLFLRTVGWFLSLSNIMNVLTKIDTILSRIMDYKILH